MKESDKIIVLFLAKHWKMTIAPFEIAQQNLAEAADPQMLLWEGSFAESIFPN